MVQKQHIKALSRYYNKKWLEGEKADFIIGSFKETDVTVKKDKCVCCGVVLYFADTLKENPDLMKKNAKPMCVRCLLEIDDKELMINDEQRDILRRFLNEQYN